MLAITVSILSVKSHPTASAYENVELESRETDNSVSDVNSQESGRWNTDEH